MNVVCPYCRIDGHIDEKFSGREIRCPKCQQIFVAGQEESPAGDAFQPQEESPAQDEPLHHIQWYYAQDNKPVGPLSDDEFHRLASEGVIATDTLVWNQTMPGWQQYGTLLAGADTHDIPSTPSKKTAARQDNHDFPLSDSKEDSDDDTHAIHMGGLAQAVCSQCHGTFSPDEVIRIGSVTLCAVCKPLYYKKVRQEVALPPQVQYAGFWIRFVAKLIDSMIIMVAGGIISHIMGIVFPSLLGDQPQTLSSIKGGHSLIELLLGISYNTFFVGRFAATPGKMALGLKIIIPTGGKVTYQRAFARSWAEVLSFLIFCIGYIMVSFDNEKRGLHDRICDTRVVSERD